MGLRRASDRIRARLDRRKGAVKQRGFALMGYAVLAAVVVIGALGISLKVQTSRLESVKAEYAQFKGGVEALGKAAEAATKAKEAADNERKVKADAENKATAAANARTISELRHQRDSARSGFLSSTPSNSRCPDKQTCFDSADLQRAYGDLVKEVRGLADEGTAVTIDLDTAKRWARP